MASKDVSKQASFRRPERKVIAEKQAQQNQIKQQSSQMAQQLSKTPPGTSTPPVNKTVQPTASVPQDTSGYLKNIQGNTDVAAETLLEINQNLASPPSQKELAEKQQPVPPPQEQSFEKLFTLQEAANDTSKEQAQSLVEIQDWMVDMLDAPVVAAPQAAALKSTELPEKEKPQTDTKKLPPDRKRSPIPILEKMAGGVSVMASSLLMISTGLAMATVKITGLLLGGLLLMDILIANIKNIWDMFGPEIMSFGGKVVDAVTGFALTLKELWGEMGFSDVIRNLKAFAADIASGNIIGGFMDYMVKAASLFGNQLQLIAEGILRLIPGVGDKLADEMQQNRINDKIRAGHTLTEKEQEISNSKYSESNEQYQERINNRTIEYAKEKGIELKNDGGFLGSGVNAKVDTTSPEFKEAQKKLFQDNPELAKKVDDDKRSAEAVSAVNSLKIDITNAQKDEFTAGERVRLTDSIEQAKEALANPKNVEYQQQLTEYISRAEKLLNNETITVDNSKEAQSTSKSVENSKTMTYNPTQSSVNNQLVNSTVNNQSSQTMVLPVSYGPGAFVL